MVKSMKTIAILLLILMLALVVVPLALASLFVAKRWRKS